MVSDLIKAELSNLRTAAANPKLFRTSVANLPSSSLEAITEIAYNILYNRLLAETFTRKQLIYLASHKHIVKKLARFPTDRTILQRKRTIVQINFKLIQVFLEVLDTI